ncbi:hypothetical protein [Campylobacter troglodytis]|uniref:hypothetical protein n=1 Tax=Campylobacter troglodytis TaxID=654363 RepID=UPI001156EDD8|nr:hypothetical protein [Campylobacter troglodytis]
MGKKTADKSPCRAKGDLGGGYENLENSKNDKNSTNALNSSENLQENTQNSTTQSLRASATKRGNPLHFVIARESAGFS